MSVIERFHAVEGSHSASIKRNNHKDEFIVGGTKFMNTCSSGSPVKESLNIPISQYKTKSKMVRYMTMKIYLAGGELVLVVFFYSTWSNTILIDSGTFAKSMTMGPTLLYISLRRAMWSMPLLSCMTMSFLIAGFHIFKLEQNHLQVVSTLLT